ncbi:TonB-dependent receptor [Roseomonas sp. GC11]|uniref:TonB-dependent receptor n=1 Tax=Roseomonas sp. GC11 TaxID=2950546 RepID=UPI00210C2BE6|nr:TonB-dependent receptor [Roseomonas sp. GC11]MCQ4160507.1 TonB-dependent receptor [Roseomonas sp. GC11]
MVAALLATTAISSGLSAIANESHLQKITPEATPAFEVLAGPLDRALAAFGRQSRTQISYDPAVVAGKFSPGLSGPASREQAIVLLLQDSGLAYRFTDPASVLIGPRLAEATPAASPGEMAGGAPVAADGSVLLAPITVTDQAGRGAATGAGFMATPDWVYETPESVSVISREAIKGAAGARDARDLLGNVAGAYVNSSVANSPAVSPNLRGLQDMGRIVVSIDGARQNANRTLTSGGDSYVGSSGKGFVDTAFIRSVEVQRMTGASAGLAGSLAGAVTFRTVGAEDLIQPGEDWGVETNTTFGTNNQRFQSSILGATRIIGTPLTLTAGLSRQDLGEYRVGHNGTVEWSGDQSGRTSLMGRDNWSSLLKLEGDFGDLRTAIAWTHQDKSFAWSQGAGSAPSEERAMVDTITATLGWKPADNPLIDLQARIWMNRTREETLRRARGSYPASGYPDTMIHANYLTIGAGLDNTSRLATPIGAFRFNYGVEAFRDTATSNAASEAITAWPELESNFTSFSPAGRRDTASAFASQSWDATHWLTLSTGLRYDWYRLKGSPTYYGYQAATTYTASCVMSEYDFRLSQNPNFTASAALTRILRNRCGEAYNGTFYGTGSAISALSTPVSYPATTLDIDRSGSALLPSATIELKPVPWFRPYVTYSQSYRPPSTAEAFFTGDLPSATNPGYGYASNEALRPETAVTWEIGANILLDGLLTERDSLRLKLSSFDRRIEDYIVLGYFYPNATARQYTGYVNAEGTTRMRGVEAEGNYDTGRFWIGGSATWLETDWPQKVQGSWYGQQTSSDAVQLYAADVPPKFKGTIDAGMRFLNERLSLGGRVSHVTPTLSQVKTISSDGTYLTNDYTKFDLYGSYAVSGNVTVRVSVDNVTDVNHVPAGSRYPAPGRTFYVSLQTRW